MSGTEATSDPKEVSGFSIHLVCKTQIQGRDKLFADLHQGISLLSTFGIHWTAGSTVLSVLDIFPEETSKAIAGLDRKSCIILLAIDSEFPRTYARIATVPLIVVPLSDETGNGVTALTSIESGMEPCYPYLMVGVDSVFNAMLLAVQIFSVSDDDLDIKFKNYRLRMQKEAKAAAKAFSESHP